MRPTFGRDYIENEFHHIAEGLSHPLTVYLIGGGAMSLRDLKGTTSMFVPPAEMNGESNNLDSGQLYWIARTIGGMDVPDPGMDTWKEHTTAFDRVRSIAQTLDQPRRAQYVAEEAAVSETTAHDHLKRLVDMNVLHAVEGEDAKLYEPDPLYTRFRTLRRLIDEHTHEELLERKSALQEEIEELEAEYEVATPTDLREQAADADTAGGTMGLIEAASDWDLARYHLSIVNEAIDKYTEYTALDRRVHA